MLKNRQKLKCETAFSSLKALKHAFKMYYYVYVCKVRLLADVWYFIAYFEKVWKTSTAQITTPSLCAFISSMCSRSLCHLEKCHLSNKLFAIKRAVKHKYQVLTVFYEDTSSRRDFRFSNKKWMVFIIVKFVPLFSVIFC